MNAWETCLERKIGETRRCSALIERNKEVKKKILRKGYYERILIAALSSRLAKEYLYKWRYSSSKEVIIVIVIVTLIVAVLKK